MQAGAGPTGDETSGRHHDAQGSGLVGLLLSTVRIDYADAENVGLLGLLKMEAGMTHVAWDRRKTVVPGANSHVLVVGDARLTASLHPLLVSPRQITSGLLASAGSVSSLLRVGSLADESGHLAVIHKHVGALMLSELQRRSLSLHRGATSVVAELLHTDLSSQVRVLRATNRTSAMRQVRGGVLASIAAAQKEFM